VGLNQLDGKSRFASASFGGRKFARRIAPDAVLQLPYRRPVSAEKFNREQKAARLKAGDFNPTR